VVAEPFDVLAKQQATIIPATIRTPKMTIDAETALKVLSLAAEPTLEDLVFSAEKPLVATIERKRKENKIFLCINYLLAMMIFIYCHSDTNTDNHQKT
jgi:hypothetical protein